MAAATTKCATSKRIIEIEAQLANLDAQKATIKESESALKNELKGLIEGADMTRTLNWRISESASSGALNTQALCKHFGCSPSFLSRFRSKGKRTKSLVKAKHPANPKLIDVSW